MAIFLVGFESKIYLEIDFMPIELNGVVAIGLKVSPQMQLLYE